MNPPGVQEPGAKDHDSFTRALLQLHLDSAELAMDDSHHSLDLFGWDGSRTRLFPQQVHHVVCEFVASLCGGGGVRRLGMKVRETEGCYVLFFFSICKLQYKAFFKAMASLKIWGFSFVYRCSFRQGGKNIRSEHLTVNVSSHYM